jgi:hypothetical protein
VLLIAPGKRGAAADRIACSSPCTWAGINFRGSTGFGHGFTRAISSKKGGDWSVGGLDTIACVQHTLAKHGAWIDAERVVGLGASCSAAPTEPATSPQPASPTPHTHTADSRLHELAIAPRRRPTVACLLHELAIAPRRRPTVACSLHELAIAPRRRPTVACLLHELAIAPRRRPDGASPRARARPDGGFTSNWLNGNAPKGMFKALVCHCGTFDLASSYYATEELFFMEHEFGGTPYVPTPHTPSDPTLSEGGTRPP